MCDVSLCDYYKQWIDIYKNGAVTDATLKKYLAAYNWLVKIAPDMKLADVNRLNYQGILNEYALYHERQTVIDFNRYVKSALLDLSLIHISEPTRPY